MTTISPKRLAQRLRHGAEPVVLDIRDADEFDDWHVPNSTNIEIADALRDDPPAAKEALRALPREEEIVTVCGVGVTSQVATELLRELGYEAKTLEEGLMGWSRVHVSAPVPVDLSGTLLQVARPGKGCLSYVLISGGEAVVFDPSQYVAEYESILDDVGAELVAVADTHAHADHLSGARRLADTHDVPYYLHADDAIAVPARTIEDGDSIRVGAVDVEVVHTPGHSPGAVTYDVAGEALLTGDTLFHRSVGRVELGATVGLADSDVERNAERLYESINRILSRGGSQMVLPAHDSGSPDPPVVATVNEVRASNPDVGRDRPAFVADVASNVSDLPPNVRQIKLANAGLEEIADGDRTSLELGPNRCAAE